MKFSIQRHRLTKRLRPNHRAIDGFPFPTPLHHCSTGTWDIMTGYQKKLHRVSRGKKKIEDTRPAIEPGMIEMLELSDWGNVKQL